MAQVRYGTTMLTGRAGPCRATPSAQARHEDKIILPGRAEPTSTTARVSLGFTVEGLRKIERWASTEIGRTTDGSPNGVREARAAAGEAERLARWPVEARVRLARRPTMGRGRAEVQSGVRRRGKDVWEFRAASGGGGACVGGQSSRQQREGARETEQPPAEGRGRVEAGTTADYAKRNGKLKVRVFCLKGPIRP